MKFKLITICLFLFFGYFGIANANDYTADFDRASSEYANRTDTNLSSGWLGKNSGGHTGDFTIEGWFNIDQLPSTAGGSFTLVSKYNGTNDSFYLYVKNSDDTGRIIFGSGAGARTFWLTDSALFVSGDVGNWVHIAVSCDVSASTCVFYKDGSIETSSSAETTATAVALNPDAFHIGNTALSTDYYDGKMDDIRIWTDIRTQGEIQDNDDNCDLSSSESGLIAWYKFENDWTDETTGGNDLTAFNTPTFQSADMPYTCAEASSTPATSTIEMADENWYSDDLTIIKGRTDIYTDSTTTPSEIRLHYFHIPFFAWVIIFSGIFIIGSRLILEILIRFRNDKFR